jgi:hypothetical protein
LQAPPGTRSQDQAAAGRDSKPRRRLSIPGVLIRRTLDSDEGGHMQYALLIYGGGDWDSLSEAEQEAQMNDYRDIAISPGTKSGADLGDLSGATTVRVENGKALTTDGPFAETKEYLGGFYLIEAGDLDGAIEVAAKIPAARTGGAIEVRPVVEH